MKFNKILYEKLTVKSFIDAIRCDSLSMMKPHIISEKFTERDYQQALTLSAFWNKPNTLKYLANLDWDFLDKNSALTAAAAAGRISSINILDLAGADLHTDEELPLYITATRLHRGTVAFLLLKEPDFNHVDYALKTVFNRGHKKFALDCIAFQAQAGDPQKALSWSLNKNKPLFVVGALKAGADANYNNGELLFKSLREGNHKMAELLGISGADILAKGEKYLYETLQKSKSIDCLNVAKHLIKKAKRSPTVLKTKEGCPRMLTDLNKKFSPINPEIITPPADAEFEMIKVIKRTNFKF